MTDSLDNHPIDRDYCGEEKTTDHSALADSDAFETVDWGQTPLRGREGDYLSPETDPEKRLDGTVSEYSVGSNTVGRTHFRPREGNGGYNRLKKIDDGVAKDLYYPEADVTRSPFYGGETSTSRHRVNGNEVFQTRTAEAVCCQIGLSQYHRREVSRLIAEKDLRGVPGGLDGAIVGFIARVLCDDYQDAVKHPIVSDAIQHCQWGEPSDAPKSQEVINYLILPERAIHWAFKNVTYPDK